MEESKRMIFGIYEGQCLRETGREGGTRRVVGILRHFREFLSKISGGHWGHPGGLWEERASEIWGL